MPKKTRVLLSWSSGKDSAFALTVLRADPAVEVAGLLTTVNAGAGRVAMHAVRRELLAAQARELDLPLDEVPIPDPCSNEQYERAMSAAVGRARAAGVEEIAFGDLFLEDVRRYREERLAGTGLGARFPLWGRDTAELAREMVASGLRARLTCVDPRRLDARFCGRSFDAELLAALPPEIDPCGENGEFHTFAFAGPPFERPLELRLGETVERGGFVFTDLLPAQGLDALAAGRPGARGAPGTGRGAPG